MKVSLDLKNEKVKNQSAVSFEGYKFVKSEDGFRELEVSYPYDENRDNCYLEVYKLDKDDHGNYFATARAYTKKGRDKYLMKPGANRIDLANEFGIGDNQPFAYHFLLVDKNTGYTKTRIDAGDVIDERNPNNDNRNIFNVVTPSKSNLSRGGAMKLVVIDSQKVGYVYNDRNLITKNEKLANRGENGIKTIANKFGGTLAGLEYAIDRGEYDNYGRIISLPVFTDDDFSAHAYWNKNCMQMASSLGNINNYASLQRKMFAHGLNFVSDGAFVNEGLEGVHFNHLLKWGEESPYYHWFKASGIKDNPLSLGIFVKNKKYISHKIVNSPYWYSQDGIGFISIKKNSRYDKTKPTYIQFFDTRLVSEEERKDYKSLIKSYSIMSTPEVYDLHTHNDSVFPYAFEVDPEAYNKNIKRLNAYNSRHRSSFIDIGSPNGTRILSKYRNFVVDGKHEGGFDTWDANPDIAKLNFVFSNADTKALMNFPIRQRPIEEAKILRGNYQVQDYAVTSGQFWTKVTDDILRLHIAQNLKKIDPSNPSLVYDKIRTLSDNKTFPESVKAEVTRAEVENLLAGFYNNKRKLSNENKQSQVLEGLMNTPLDSFELGDNIVSVLASPLISKRAATDKEIGVSRYDLFKNGDKNLPAEYKKTYEMMNSIYKEEMSNFAMTVLNTVDEVFAERGQRLFNGDEVTEYGKYVLPLITPIIAKYAVIKSLAPNITVAIDKNTGEFTYDYKNLKQVSLQTLGITHPVTPEEEALMLLSHMRKGMKELNSSIDSEIVETIVRSLKDTSLESFQLADLIIDKTQSGLDWRIDATKDIGDVEALRNGNTNFEYTWNQVIDFWKKFVQGVVTQNPNAYLVAEITDTDNLHDIGQGYLSNKFPKKDDIVRKFLRETGITSTAHYDHYFNKVPKMFTKIFESAEYSTDQNYLQKLMYSIMVEGGAPYVRSASLDSLMYSYTFIGNHDKPRALHCSALDMSLFYDDFTYPGVTQNKRTAYQILNNKFLDSFTDHEVEHYDFSAVSPKAIAMANALHPAFVNMLNSYKTKYPELNNPEVFNKAFIPICKAVSDLAQGKFLNKRFDPEAFGIKPIDVSISMVLKQAKSEYGFSLPANAAANYENDVFEAVMRPAMSKVLAMMKFLVALPGMPTLFDGDDAGATGYDTKTKNMYLQGRQRIHDEWLDVNNEKYKKFIDEYKGFFDEVMALRKDPKCNALNNGAVYTLPLQQAESKEFVPAIFRQSTDGRMAISLFNTSALHVDPKRNYERNDLTLDAITLNFETKKDDNGRTHTVTADGNPDGNNDFPVGNVGIPGLKNNTVFYNAKDPNDKYYVNEVDGKYFIKRATNGGKITINDTTLVLYHVPENTALTFTGRYEFKPNSRYVTGAYQNKNVECGKNLALVK